MKRATALLVTLLLTAAATFLAPASATAVAQEAKPKRPISITWEQVGSTINVKLTGQATDYGKKNIQLLKKDGNRWAKVKSSKTQSNGKFTFKVVVPRDRKTHSFKVMTKKDSTYAKSYSKVVALKWS
jgi:5-hydroxyisourate hydrolase-like protein (transthyretin family)